jgi:hypothetical protein
MNVNISGKIYCACLRLKQGEYTAVGLLTEDIKDHFLPYFIAPPPKDWDPERNRRLTQVELITDTAKRIGKHWPLRPALLDTSYISDALGDANTHEWLPNLFSLIRQYHGNCIPVIKIDSNSSEKIGVKKIYTAQPTQIAIRIPISHIDDPNLYNKIYGVINSVGCSPERTIIAFDCEDMSLDPVTESLPIIENALKLIFSLGMWSKLILIATSYPDHNPAKQNGDAEVERHELSIWSEISRNPDLSKFNISFGDYGADCSLIDFTTRKGGKTIAHLRYSTVNCIYVVRGGKSSDEDDDGTIRSVTKRLIASTHFDRENQSAAEDFIIECADKSGSPGNPTTWRKINTLRHISCTVAHLLSLRGTALPVRPKKVRYRQSSLFDQKSPQ